MCNQKDKKKYQLKFAISKGAGWLLISVDGPVVDDLLTYAE